MNAQKKWKEHYRLWLEFSERCDRYAMYNVRREALLERRLAAAQRTIKALEDLLVSYG